MNNAEIFRIARREYANDIPRITRAMVGIKRIRCKSGKPKGNPYPNFMGVPLSITASTGSKHRHKTTDCDGEYPVVSTLYDVRQ